MVQEIADNINRNDYVRKEELRRKADDLCELFHSVTPIEKYENLRACVHRRFKSVAA